MTKRAVLVRHNDGPLDDRVASYFSLNGCTIDVRHPFLGESLEGVVEDDVAGTVVYGGPFNVYETDKHPFLNEEYRWIDACLTAGIPVLGICQGAQQIAYHLGAWAGAPEREVHEFGYYEVHPTPEAGDFMPRPLHVAQAHFHTFDLPEGAVRLAGNDAYPNQAVRFRENVYGLQFHAEQTIESFRRWQDAKWAVYGKPGAQTREEQDRLMVLHDKAQADWFYGFMGQLFGRVLN